MKISYAFFAEEFDKLSIMDVIMIVFLVVIVAVVILGYAIKSECCGAACCHRLLNVL